MWVGVGLGIPSLHVGCNLWSPRFLAVLCGVTVLPEAYSLVSRGFFTCVSLRGFWLASVLSPYTAYCLVCGTCYASVY